MKSSSNKLSESLKKELISALSKFNKNPNNAETYIQLADTFLKAGRSLEAIRQFQIARSIEPDNERPYLMLANIYKSRHELKKAVNELEKAIKKGAAGPRTYELLGEIYENSQEYEKALKYYKKVRELAPDKVDIYIKIEKLEKNIRAI